MIPILLVLMVSPLPCRLSRGSSMSNLLNPELAISSPLRITGPHCLSAMIIFAHLPISSSPLHLLPTTPQPHFAIQNT
jgi:hypothetical protein